MTNSGIGYKVYWGGSRLEMFSEAFFYTSHIIRENSEHLYGFMSLKDKMLFELLISVKGVGPKSAFSLIGSLGFKQIVGAITLENKKLLTTAPGIGNKAASQIILDLNNKLGDLQKLPVMKDKLTGLDWELEKGEGHYHEDSNKILETSSQFLQDTVMACKDLGFKEDIVVGVASSILHQREIKSSEELLHLVLKGL